MAGAGALPQEGDAEGAEFVHPGEETTSGPKSSLLALCGPEPGALWEGRVRGMRCNGHKLKVSQFIYGRRQRTYCAVKQN